MPLNRCPFCGGSGIATLSDKHTQSFPADWIDSYRAGQFVICYRCSGSGWRVPLGYAVAEEAFDPDALESVAQPIGGGDAVSGE